MDTPLASIELLAGRAAVEPEGTLALPVRDHVNAATMMSLLHTNWRDHPMDRIVLQGNVLTMQRNEAVQKMRGKYLIFVDDDMVFAPEAINQLVDSYADLAAQVEGPVMLGALCFRRQPPYQPTLYMREKPTEGAYNFLEEWEPGLVEVDATGMAFVLIPITVFEVIAGTEMPSFEERISLGGLPSFFRWEKNYGEDLQFCQDAKAAGVRIFVDTTIKTGHIAEVEIREQDFVQQLAHRPQRVYAERLIVNKRMGLPTVSPEKARERLGW